MSDALRERLATPVGVLGLALDGEGRVTRLTFLGEGVADDAAPSAASAEVRDALDSYFGGAGDALEGLAVRTSGSAFQEAVWTALRAIPAGRTASYGEIARQIGQPGAAREVGRACNRNPVVLVTPCHRVIGADGALVGFGGGLERKRWLLEHEGAIAPEPPRLL